MAERIIHGYKPDGMFGFFEEISAIPRGSGNEGGMADYLAAFAQKRGFYFIRDGANNVFISKNASSGREGEPAVLLQGHTDMVCAKTAESSHNFLTDPLELFIENGNIGARGTTLGGDNGIAVAVMLELLDGDYSLPPLECLFTVSEETGMSGAFAFDCRNVTAHSLINLDSEAEGYATAGCAGGVRVKITLPYERVSASYKAFTIELSGLMGGHSGAEIDKYRGNAINIMGRLLAELYENEPFCLVTVSGGVKDNAIPAECKATVTSRDPAASTAFLLALEAKIKAELPAEDRGFKLRVSKPKKSDDTLSFAETSRVISMLTLFPHGPQAFSRDMPGLVETSSNLGVVSDSGSAIITESLLRSSVESRLDELLLYYRRLAKFIGVQTEEHSRYPGWKYNPKSKLREKFVDCYNKTEGRAHDAHVSCTHAGLECGIFIGAIPGLDAISIGPNLHDIHTPSERADLASCERFFSLILKMLQKY
jgi:aminoacyl-histidine dipeptidase